MLISRKVTEVSEISHVNLRAEWKELTKPKNWNDLIGTDRTLKKTSKASLTRQLERNVSFSDEIPQPSTCIIDGMGLVQKAHGEGKTFGEL